jgi:hypothetical protein
MIINPFWFYLIGIANTLGVFLTVMAGVSSIFYFIFLICYFVTSAENGFIDKKEQLIKKNMDNFLRKGSIMCFILIIVACLIPDEKTCYQMLTASLCTKENIEYLKETGKDLVDYIIETADTLTNGEKEEEREN